MDTPILETERLAFHPFTPDDYDLLADLHADPEVQRYVGGLWTRDVIQTRLDTYVAEQARYGFSKWKAYLRDGTFAGRCGVSFWDRIGEFELGYTFRRSAWGQGLATEAAQAVADRFFRVTPHPRLHGFTDVENLASRRVLARIGMAHVGDEDLGFGGISAKYLLERP
ncbi:MAG: GNAT family N-acetyltransferase [Phenylobacterium sp.]